MLSEKTRSIHRKGTGAGKPQSEEIAPWLRCARKLVAGLVSYIQVSKARPRGARQGPSYRRGYLWQTSGATTLDHHWSLSADSSWAQGEFIYEQVPLLCSDSSLGGEELSKGLAGC